MDEFVERRADFKFKPGDLIAIGDDNSVTFVVDEDGDLKEWHPGEPYNYQ